MAYNKRTWINDETELNAQNMNHIEEGIENAYNVYLLAVTDAAPTECSTGDKYYNTTDKKIYTATGEDTWSSTGETPLDGILYVLFDARNTFAWDGTDLISVGGGGGVYVGTEPPEDDNVNYWVNPDDNAPYPDFAEMSVDKLNAGEIETDNIKSRNLFDGRTLQPITYAGLTYSPQNDGSIVINGTKYGADLANFKSNFFVLKAGTYTLSTTLLDGSVSNIKKNALSIRDYTTTNVLATLGYFASSPSSITFTLASDSICYISFYYGDNMVFNNAKIAIQIEKGDTQTSYSPYKAFDSTAYVLWTNPNPTSSFAGQIVTLNDAIGNYRYHEIIYHYYSDGGSGQTIENRIYQSTGKLVYGRTRIFTFDEKIRFRSVDLSGTSATFGNGVTYSNYGSSSTETTNFVCIPYQILGYK